MNARDRFRRCVNMAPPPADDAANFARLAPFEDVKPCACGSRNRTRNLDGAVFCQRCGKQHSRSQVEIRDQVRQMRFGTGA